MSSRKRLDRAERRAGLGRDAFRTRLRSMTNAEVLDLLHAALLQERRPALAIPREELGPSHQGAFATMSDEEVLEMLEDAREAVRIR